MTKKKQKKSQRTAVVVLGMHRSGTSALAGVLGILGCDQPATLMKPNENNKKGYFESDKLYQLHTRLLASAASSWDDWMAMPKGWFEGPRALEYHDQAMETMAGEFGKSRLFVLKDPRICRLVPFWEEVLDDFGARPAYVLTHRNPLEVARSLNKRDGMPIGLGLLIWLRHVLEAEAGTRGQPRCITSYEQLIANWAGVVDKIQQTLSINLPRFSQGAVAEIENFLESDLRHQRELHEKIAQNPMITVWVRDTYEILESWLASGESADDYDRLDEIRAELDAAGPAFAQVVQAGRSATRQLTAKVETLATELQATKEERKALTSDLETAQADATRLAAKAEEMQKALTAREERLKALDEELGTIKARATELEATAAELETMRETLSEAQSSLDGQSRLAAEASQALISVQASVAETQMELETVLREREALATQLDEAQDQLAQTQSALAQRSHEAEETRNELIALRDEYEERARETELSRERERSEALQVLEHERASRAQERAALDEERAARARAEASAADLNSRLQTQYGEMATVSRFLAESEQALKQAQAESEAALAALTAQIAAEKASSAAERARLAASAAHYKAELDAIRASTTWRLMRPVLSVLDWMRGDRT